MSDNTKRRRREIEWVYQTNLEYEEHLPQVSSLPTMLLLHDTFIDIQIISPWQFPTTGYSKDTLKHDPSCLSVSKSLRNRRWTIVRHWVWQQTSSRVESCMLQLANSLKVIQSGTTSLWSLPQRAEAESICAHAASSPPLGALLPMKWFMMSSRWMFCSPSRQSGSLGDAASPRLPVHRCNQKRCHLAWTLFSKTWKKWFSLGLSWCTYECNMKLNTLIFVPSPAIPFKWRLMDCRTMWKSSLAIKSHASLFFTVQSVLGCQLPAEYRCVTTVYTVVLDVGLGFEIGFNSSN